MGLAAHKNLMKPLLDFGDRKKTLEYPIPRFFLNTPIINHGLLVGDDTYLGPFGMGVINILVCLNFLLTVPTNYSHCINIHDSMINKWIE